MVVLLSLSLSPCFCILGFYAGGARWKWRRIESPFKKIANRGEGDVQPTDAPANPGFQTGAPADPPTPVPKASEGEHGPEEANPSLVDAQGTAEPELVTQTTHPILPEVQDSTDAGHTGQSTEPRETPGLQTQAAPDHPTPAPITFEERKPEHTDPSLGDAQGVPTHTKAHQEAGQPTDPPAIPGFQTDTPADPATPVPTASQEEHGLDDANPNLVDGKSSAQPSDATPGDVAAQSTAGMVDGIPTSTDRSADTSEHGPPIGRTPDRPLHQTGERTGDGIADKPQGTPQQPGDSTTQPLTHIPESEGTRERFGHSTTEPGEQPEGVTTELHETEAPAKHAIKSTHRSNATPTVLTPATKDVIRHTTEADHHATEADHDATEADHHTTEADHHATEADHHATEADHYATEADHHATEADHQATEADHQATEADHHATETLTLQPTEAVTLPPDEVHTLSPEALSSKPTPLTTATSSPTTTSSLHVSSPPVTSAQRTRSAPASTVEPRASGHGPLPAATVLDHGSGHGPSRVTAVPVHGGGDGGGHGSGYGRTPTAAIPQHGSGHAPTTVEPVPVHGGGDGGGHGSGYGRTPTAAIPQHGSGHAPTTVATMPAHGGEQRPVPEATVPGVPKQTSRIAPTKAVTTGGKSVPVHSGNVPLPAVGHDSEQETPSESALSPNPTTKYTTQPFAGKEPGTGWGFIDAVLLAVLTLLLL